MLWGDGWRHQPKIAWESRVKLHSALLLLSCFSAAQATVAAAAALSLPACCPAFYYCLPIKVAGPAAQLALMVLAIWRLRLHSPPAVCPIHLQ